MLCSLARDTRGITAAGIAVSKLEPAITKEMKAVDISMLDNGNVAKPPAVMVCYEFTFF